MGKYNIEESIDFYAELYKSLDNNDEESDNNRCLITDQLLIDKYVTLDCGHKFNYIPLYNDLKNHKKKFNCMEGCSSKLRTNEIRCPYCRSKQTKLLPYYEDLGVEKVNGVNNFDPNIKETTNYNYYGHNCEYNIPNPNFDQCKPESNTNKKYTSCTSFNGSKIVLYNKTNPLESITYGDNKYYCYFHKKIIIKEYKLKEKEKEKEAKQKEKEEAKLAKQKLKEEEKLLKQKSKLKNNKNFLTENVVLESSIIINQDSNQETKQIGCIQILKSGPKKGNACGCKIHLETLCKRHYSLNNKEKN